MMNDELKNFIDFYLINGQSSESIGLKQIKFIPENTLCPMLHALYEFNGS
jgi:hypothetical protein